MVLKQLFFSKNYKKSPSPHTPIASSGWGLCPQTLINDTFELQHTSLFKHVSEFRHFHILIGLGLLLWPSA